MDVMVMPVGTNAWRLQDELGRHLGDITRLSADTIVITSGSLLADVHAGPFISLRLAMAEISRTTRGTCQLVGEP